MSDNQMIFKKLDEIQSTQAEMRLTQATMAKDVSQNTEDLSEHIKRTNILEGKLQKIIYLLILGAGIGIALYGPDVIKILGILL